MSDLKVDPDIFNNEERILLNSMITNVLLRDFTRDRVLDQLIFTKNATNDSMVVSLCEGLIDKMFGISAEQWEHISWLFPLSTLQDV